MDTLGNGSYLDWQAGTLSTNALFSSAGAAGAYVATPLDLSKWMYDLYSGALLSAASTGEMTVSVPNSGGYGLGSMILQSNCSLEAHGHNGGIFYRSSSFYNPEHDLAVVIQTNDANLPVNLDAFALDILCSYSEVVSTPELATEAPAVQLYPNPSTGNATVRVPYSNNYELTVLDALGRQVVQRSNAKGATQQLELTTPGTYFVRVRSGEQVEVQRLLVQ